MKVPSDAIIAREKLTQYLLVYRRQSDKSKFLALAGFTEDNPDALEAAIRLLIQTHDAVLDRRDDYGDYYRVEGALIGVNQHTLDVVTIWIMQAHVDGKFRFVTLKPRK